MPLQIIDSNIEGLMQTFGVTAKWYRARLCSCVGENNGTYKLNHTCNQGFYYSEPEIVHLIRTQVSQKMLNQPNGVIFNGGSTFTIPKIYNGVEQKIWRELAHGDIISIEGKTRRDTDILIRGVRDSLQAFDVAEIITVAKDDKVFVEGVDYRVNGVTIEWISGGESPNENDYYTVEFICSQQYRIWNENPNDRGTDDDELPKRVVATLRRYVNPDVNVVDTYNFRQELF